MNKAATISTSITRTLTPEQVDPLDVLSFGKPIRRHVEEFSAIMAIVLLIIAGVKLYHHAPISTPIYLLAGACFLLLLGYLSPRILYPFWKGWMAFAGMLGHIMTSVIVSLGWVIMMVPLALVLKIVGKKVMDLSYKAPVTTYWEDRDPKHNDFKLLERQF